MNVSVLIILIISAFVLYGVKTLNESHQNGSLKDKLEKAAHKALLITIKGVVAIGFIWLALSFFPIVRGVGFTFFSTSMIHSVRIILDVIFDTRSVYVALEMLVSLTLVLVEIAFIFSILDILASPSQNSICLLPKFFAYDTFV